MSKTKRQHYVPVASLRRFGNSRGKVFAFDKRTEKAFETEPENVACENYFYELEGLTDDPTKHSQFQAVEKAFRTIEAAGQQVISEILLPNGSDPNVIPSLSSLTNQQREALSLFIAAQYLRTSKQRDFTSEMLRAFTRVFVNTQIYGSELTPRDVKISVSNNHKIHAHCLFTLRSIPKLAKALVSHYWMLAIADGSASFVLSDAPVVVMPDAETLSRYPIGSIGSKTIMPLSPKVSLLMLAGDGRLPVNAISQFLADDDDVLGLNQLQVYDSKAQIYSQDPDLEWVRVFIAPQKGNKSARLECSGPFTELTGDDEETSNPKVEIRW